MLPGIFNSITGAGGGDTLEHVSTTTATAHGGTLTMPTLQVGDIIIVYQYAYASSATNPTAAYGTGFTSLDTNGVDWGTKVTVSATSCLSYRVAQSGDSGASKTGFMNGHTEAAIIMVWRPSWTSTATITAFDKTSGASAVAYIPSPIGIGASASSEFTLSLACVCAEDTVSQTFTPADEASQSIGGLQIGTMLMEGLAQEATATNISGARSSGATTSSTEAYMYTELYLEIT